MLPAPDHLPDHLSEAESAVIGRRRRSRNIAMLVVLVLLCVLFYAVSIVKLTKG